MLVKWAQRCSTPIQCRDLRHHMTTLGHREFNSNEFSLIPQTIQYETSPHDDVIRWKHFPRYLPFVREIHRSPVNSPQKGQWRGALMFSLICAWINGWVNSLEAGVLRRHCAHCDVIAMYSPNNSVCNQSKNLALKLIYISLLNFIYSWARFCTI